MKRTLSVLRTCGDHVAGAMKLVADDVEGVVIPDAGHFVAEEAPGEMLTALNRFLAPYRDRMAVPRSARAHGVAAAEPQSSARSA
jgi:hypothetical protein